MWNANMAYKAICTVLVCDARKNDFYRKNKKNVGLKGLWRFSVIVKISESLVMNFWNYILRGCLTNFNVLNWLASLEPWW